MDYYCDTSALVKRYFREKGSAALHRKLKPSASIAVSLLAYPELVAAVHRLNREGALSDSQKDAIMLRIDTDWKTFTRIPLTEEIQVYYKEIFARSPLRGADAVHLASAVFWKTVVPSVVFVCSDAQLLSAARRMGLGVFDPANSA